MIQKLRKRFIIVASCCIIAILTIVLVVFNISCYYFTYNEFIEKLTFITQNGGRLPDENPSNEDVDFFVSPEFRFQTRYFTVIIDENGDYITSNNDNIYNISLEETVEIGKYIYDLEKKQGKISLSDSVFLFKVQEENGSSFTDKFEFNNNSIVILKDNINYKIITFMDCTESFYRLKTMCIRSIFICGCCFIAFLILVSVFSNKAVKPFADNYMKQKQFITNAGHELKTPLTIISANAEVIEALNGQSEWTDSIQHQVSRLTDLVNNLISIVRLDESAEKQDIVMEKTDIKSIFQSTADDFKLVAKQQGKNLDYSVSNVNEIKGNSKMLKELIAILFDNAVKYCDDNGEIHAEIRQQKQQVHIEISNSYAHPTNCNNFFDRFYREDTSHNSEKSGFGIGLSMAETFVRLHNGKITAYQKNDKVYFSVVI